jgi:hypothetical protein
MLKSLLKRLSMKDVLEYNSKWGVTRYASEQDAEKKVIYRPAFALEAFGGPQITTIEGGLHGAILNLPVVLAALKRGEPFTEIFNRLRHLFKGNLLLNEGINELWTILCTASSGTKFDNTNAYLGVGDDTTSESASQTGLQASTNKLYKAMDSGFPTSGTSQLATWRSTFGASDANFNWNEFTVANGNSDASVNLNRKVSNQGTKVSGQQWQLSLQITLS